MADEVIEVTDETFEAEVLQADVPVLVDLWAPWCGPCRMVSPVIEQLADENAGKLKTCKLNVDENRDAASNYAVSAIPTVLLFKDGKEVQRMVGAQPKAEYQKAVDEALGG